MNPDAQTLDYLANLEADVSAFLNAYDRMADRFQEAYDRDLDQLIPDLDFSKAGNLDHLSAARLGDALAAAAAVQSTLEADGRLNLGRLLGLVRSWTR